MSPAKTANPIEMPFDGLHGREVQETMYSTGVEISTGRGSFGGFVRPIEKHCKSILLIHSRKKSITATAAIYAAKGIIHS